MKYTAHYMRPDFFRDGIAGVRWLTEQNLLPTLATLDKTHVELKTLEFDRPADAPDWSDEEWGLEPTYCVMQAENWSPKGEARDLIRSKGLEHTSMSVGDVIVVDDRLLYIVDRVGFKKLEG